MPARLGFTFQELIVCKKKPIEPCESQGAREDVAAPGLKVSMSTRHRSWDKPATDQDSLSARFSKFLDAVRSGMA